MCVTEFATGGEEGSWWGDLPENCNSPSLPLLTPTVPSLFLSHTHPTLPSGFFFMGVCWGQYKTQTATNHRRGQRSRVSASLVMWDLHCGCVLLCLNQMDIFLHGRWWTFFWRRSRLNVENFLLPPIFCDVEIWISEVYRLYSERESGGVWVKLKPSPRRPLFFPRVKADCCNSQLSIICHVIVLKEPIPHSYFNTNLFPVVMNLDQVVHNLFLNVTWVFHQPFRNPTN